MNLLDEQNQAVREGTIMQVILRIERELGKPPAHPMAVRRLANSVARAIGGEWWRAIANEAIRRWELG